MKQQQATWAPDDWKPRKGPHRLAPSDGPTRWRRRVLAMMEGSVVLRPTSGSTHFTLLGGAAHAFAMTRDDFDRAARAHDGGERIFIDGHCPFFIEPGMWKVSFDESALSIEFTQNPPPPPPRLTFRAPL